MRPEEPHSAGTSVRASSGKDNRQGSGCVWRGEGLSVPEAHAKGGEAAGHLRPEGQIQAYHHVTLENATRKSNIAYIPFLHQSPKVHPRAVRLSPMQSGHMGEAMGPLLSLTLGQCCRR